MAFRILSAFAAITFLFQVQAQTTLLSYSTYLGGNAADSISAIAFDRDGNVFVTGFTNSDNFPVTAGAYQKAHAGKPGTSDSIFTGSPASDAFVAKYSRDGKLIYATYLGGSGSDTPSAIAIDGQGNTYVFGTTNSPNFPTTPGALQGAGTLNRLFLSKLNATGTALVYSLTLSGQNVLAGSLALDADGNAYLSGAGGSGLTATAGAYQSTGDAFVAKVNPSGSALVYATRFGPQASTQAPSLAVDGAGRVYLAGTTSEAIPITPGAYQSTFRGTSAAYLAQLNATGTALVFSTLLTGNASVKASSLAVDRTGALWIAGLTDSRDLPVTANAPEKTALGAPYSAPFLARFNPTATSLEYLTYFGVSANITSANLTLDPEGNPILAGRVSTSGLPVTADALPRGLADGVCFATGLVPFGKGAPAFPCGHSFVARFDRTTGAIRTVTYLGGTERDNLNAAATSPTGEVYFAGSTRSSDFPVTDNAAQDLRVPATCTSQASPSSSGSEPCSDGFLTRLDFSGRTALPVFQALNLATMAEVPLAPNEIVALMGAGIGPTETASMQVVNNQVTTQLNNTRVLVDGTPAPLLLVSANQINFIVPNNVKGKQHVQVTIERLERLGNATQSRTLRVGASAPGILTLDAIRPGQAAAINEDGTLNSPANPAKPGSFVSLYVLGLGTTAGADGEVIQSAKTYDTPGFIFTPGISIGGFNVEPIYVGAAPLLVNGVSQINLKLPEIIPRGDSVPVHVRVGDYSSPDGAFLSIK